MRPITARAFGLLLVFLPGLLSAQARPNGVSEIPVRLEVKTAASAVEVGSKCAVTVSLKNVNDQNVSALKDVEVAVNMGSMGGSASVTIPKGKVSATVMVTASRSGIAEIEASAPKLFPGSALLLVRPRKRPAIAPERRIEATVTTTTSAALPPPEIPPPAPEALEAKRAAAASAPGPATAETRSETPAAKTGAVAPAVQKAESPVLGRPTLGVTVAEHGIASPATVGLPPPSSRAPQIETVASPETKTGEQPSPGKPTPAATAAEEAAVPRVSVAGEAETKPEELVAKAGGEAAPELRAAEKPLMSQPTSPPAGVAAPAPAPQPGDLLESTFGVNVTIPVPPRPPADTWTANVLLTVLAANGAVTKATRELTVILTVNLGTISPNRVQIHPGQDSFDKITLTSQTAGQDVVTAQSDLGPPVLKPVVYGDFPPDRLAVEPSPTEAPDDGRTPVTVKVTLRNIASRPAKTDQDIEVSLSSSLGQLKDSKLKIEKDKFFAETRLTSPKSGEARITAEAPGLAAAAPANVLFRFPLFLVLLAGLGGVVGGMVGRIVFGLFKNEAKGWQSHVLPILLAVVLGAIFGVILYLLEYFAAVTTLFAKSGVDPSKVPPLNSVGAFLLGLLGGLLWPIVLGIKLAGQTWWEKRRAE